MELSEALDNLENQVGLLQGRIEGGHIDGQLHGPIDYSVSGCIGCHVDRVLKIAMDKVDAARLRLS